MELKGNLNILESAAVGFETTTPVFTDARLQVKGVATGDAATTHNTWKTDSAGNDIFEVMDNGNTLIRNGGLFIGDTGAATHDLLRVNTNLDFFIQNRATANTVMMLLSDKSGSNRVLFRVNDDGSAVSYAETGLDDQFRITAHDALNGNRNQFSIWADMDTITEPKWRIGSSLQLSSISGARDKIQALTRNLNLVHAAGNIISIEDGGGGNGVLGLKSQNTTTTPAGAAKFGVLDPASALLLIGHVGTGGNVGETFGILNQRTHFVNAYDTRVIAPPLGLSGGATTTADTRIFAVTDVTGNIIIETLQDGRFRLREFTVATAPTPVNGGVIIVTDEVGGRTMATGDGVNWRRVSDGTPIA